MMKHRGSLLFRLLAGVAFAGGLVLAGTVPALAYVGPGAGLSLLGALWAVAFAILAALAFVVIWPIRQMIRRRSARPPARARRVDPPAGPGERTLSS
jgi:membrane protein implicated in regulation of membrane protease activity